MAQRSLDMLGMGLRCGPAGLTLVKMKRRCSAMARAHQDKPVYSAIPGYLEAAQGFARLRPVTLAPPMASQLSAASATDAHLGVSRSPCADEIAAQSQCNHRRCRVRRCRKLSLGSVDSGIDLDATLGHWTSTSTDNDMRVGRVPPTLTLGHGHPPAQALAEPATPGAQFVQHMAPVPVLAQQPGDPPLGDQGQQARRPLTAAQIERRRHCHQQWAQRQCEA